MSEEQKTETVQTGQESMEKSDTVGKFSGRKWGIIGGIAVVIAAFIVGISIYNTPANRLSRELDLGQRYLEEQNYEQAIVEFDKAIEIDHMSVEAYLGKAQAYEGLGDIEMAIKTLEDGYERTGDERLLEMMQRLDPVIEWEDAAFEALIREYLGKPEGDIRKSEVCDIERIVIVGIYIEMPDERIYYPGYDDEGDYRFVTDKRDIRSETVGKIETLDDLQYFEAIRELKVYFNNISNISALVSMANLEWLVLNNNNISDVSALVSMTNLKTLELCSNNISDISGLEGLTNLEWLGLHGNNISDISVLRGLTNLYSLNLGDNNISDISGLEGLTNLKQLILVGNDISDVSALGNLTNLVYLGLGDNNISDISVLGGLENLASLDLYENNISDISVLLGLTNLEHLFLHPPVGRGIQEDISILEDLTNLTNIQLDNNISE